MIECTFRILSLCALLAACGCTPASNKSNDRQETLHVFAAASLAGAFTELCESFEAIYPDVDIVLNFAGSQQLASQINLGAPADVYASANPVQMQAVVTSGHVAPGAPAIFARNRLALITPQQNPASITHIRDLSRDGLRLILADETVPAGRYARVALENVSPAFKQEVLANVVSFEQNVRAVLTKISLGEADAGIVYQSDLMGTATIHPVPIPDSLNVEAHYLIALLNESAFPERARAFIQFIMSEEGQGILIRHGFLPVLSPGVHDRLNSLPNPGIADP